MYVSSSHDDDCTNRLADRHDCFAFFVCVDRQPDCHYLKQGSSQGDFLFNLATDPYEQENLYDSHPNKVQELMER